MPVEYMCTRCGNVQKENILQVKCLRCGYFLGRCGYFLGLLREETESARIELLHFCDNCGSEEFERFRSRLIRYFGAIESRLKLLEDKS